MGPILSGHEIDSRKPVVPSQPWSLRRRPAARQGIVPPIFVIAAYEVATNSLRRWGETTIARLWKEDEAQVCEVSDRRHIVSPLADRQKPAPLRGRPRAVAHPAT